ncbi:hypothetical protein KI387_010788, partial [Taxus chinensis]
MLLVSVYHVHSANALSERHARTLLCDMCNVQPAVVQCINHRLFLCQNCDKDTHFSSESQHRKRFLNSYTGCPSATQLANLWGCNLDEREGSISGSPNEKGSDNSGPGHLFNSLEGFKENFGSWIDSSSPSMVTLSLSEPNTNPNTTLGSPEDSSFGTAALSKTCEDHQFQSKQMHVIIQQLLDLQKLQPLGSMKLKNHHEMQAVVPAQVQEQMQDVSLIIPDSEHPKSDTNVEMSIQEDSFWHCTSASQSNQLWGENMQDLGLCDADERCDPFHMSDIDLTFENYEDIFGGPQGEGTSIFEDVEAACSSMDKDVSFADSSGCNESSRKLRAGTPAGYIALSSQEPGKAGSAALPETGVVHGVTDLSGPGNIQSALPVCSSFSLSLSSLSGESSAADYHDCGLSPMILKGEPTWGPSNSDSLFSQARDNAMMRYKEKKKLR